MINTFLTSDSVTRNNQYTLHKRAEQHTQRIATKGQ